MNAVDVTRNIKKSQKQGSSTQRGILETIQSSYHSDMRTTNLSKDIVPRVSLPFPSEKTDVKIIDNTTFYSKISFENMSNSGTRTPCRKKVIIISRLFTTKYIINLFRIVTSLIILINCRNIKI